MTDSYRSSPSPFPRGSTSSPAQRVPGYVPGMPRPMTPHDRDTNFDSDEQTPSTTPRATSPRLPGSVSTQPSPLLAQTLPSNIYRSSSTASTSRGSSSSPAAHSMSTSPLFLSRPTNGGFTPEDLSWPRNNSSSGSNNPTTPQDPAESPVYSSRRRPTSPLSAPAYQPVPVSNTTSSRPNTPSNVTWLSPSTSDANHGHVRNGYGSTSSTSGRSRSGSTTSLSDQIASSYETDRTTVGANGRTNTSATTARSLRSQDGPESVSTWYDNRHTSTASLNGATDFRSPSAMSSAADPGSPIRTQRSPTPNHSVRNATVSPTSPTFSELGANVNGTSLSPSRRTSRQNAHSSFTLSPTHALLLSPIGNSSRSSLESAGSSYHSWDEDHKKDRLFDMFAYLDPSLTEWHDLSAQASTSQTTPNDSQESCEETVRKEVGLTKVDVLAVQDKLVNAALTKAATPEGRNRTNSVRKRRPSTSQSNYSFTGAENRVSLTLLSV